MKESYKEFSCWPIGASDMASLTVRTAEKVARLDFGQDGAYSAYICQNAEIGAHYRRVFSGKGWIKIYDDNELSFDAWPPEGFNAVEIWRAGEFGTIINWVKKED